VSQKHCLAIDDQTLTQEIELEFEPKLFVNTRYAASSNSLSVNFTAESEEVVTIGGRITVSF
jgi:hypothetical protein